MTDPLMGSLDSLDSLLAKVRRGQLEALRGGRPACGHGRSVRGRREGPDEVTRCLLARSHKGLHEDEYTRTWDDSGHPYDTEYDATI